MTTRVAEKRRRAKIIPHRSKTYSSDMRPDFIICTVDFTLLREVVGYRRVQ
jgi:hypothetical protein